MTNLMPQFQRDIQLNALCALQAEGLRAWEHLRGVRTFASLQKQKGHTNLHTYDQPLNKVSKNCFEFNYLIDNDLHDGGFLCVYATTRKEIIPSRTYDHTKYSPINIQLNIIYTHQARIPYVLSLSGRKFAQRNLARSLDLKF